MQGQRLVHRPSERNHGNKEMKKPSIKSFQRKLEHRLRDWVIKRDGGKCQVCGARQNLVADHCFSRQVRQLFYWPENLTTLCSTDNFKKKLDGTKGIALKVYDIVQAREGESKFYEMYRIAQFHRAFPDFSKRYYLEGVETFIRQLEICQ